jgi:hypothetical protein
MQHPCQFTPPPSLGLHTICTHGIVAEVASIFRTQLVLNTCVPAFLLPCFLTGRNQHSSRSHAILQFWLEQQPAAAAAADSTVVRSKLDFVDLAGSERWGKAHTEALGSTL